mgnify:CR=1 FL=1
MKKISIIVPIYNVDQYLEECLTSITNQKYENIEIILVNDGSTDQSKIICECFCKRDSRFQLINKVNGGLSSARNAGLEIASGEYIAFIDSDDVVSENYILNLHKTMEKYNSDIVLSGYKRFLKKIPVIENTTKEEMLAPSETIKRVLYQKDQEFFSVSACCKLYKKILFSDIRYPENKINEDMAVIVPVLEKCKNISCTYNYDYFYRINNSSITNQSFNTRRMDAIEFSDEIVKHFKGNKKLEKAAISMLFRRSIEMLSEMKENKFVSFEIEKKLLINIKKYRKIVMLDKYARLSTKLAALLSYVNLNLVLKLRMKIRKQRYHHI